GRRPPAHPGPGYGRADDETRTVPASAAMTDTPGQLTADYWRKLAPSTTPTRRLDNQVQGSGSVSVSVSETLEPCRYPISQPECGPSWPARSLASALWMG